MLSNQRLELPHGGRDDPNHGGTANYYTLAALHFFAGVFLPIGASTAA